MTVEHATALAVLRTQHDHEIEDLKNHQVKALSALEALHSKAQDELHAALAEATSAHEQSSKVLASLV